MEALLTPIIIIFIFVLVFLLSKLREFYRDKSLRELVAWSVSTDNHIRNNLSLSAYIRNAQIELSLPQEYRISDGTESDYLNKILTEYQRDLSQAYFRHNLPVIKSKYVVFGKAYFMFALYVFLSDHQCDYELLGYNMHKERIDYKRYGDWGGPLYDATYSLTDFALVFHKLHYITYMYCKDNATLSSLVPAWCEKNLKEILDTNQIQISRY